MAQIIDLNETGDSFLKKLRGEGETPAGVKNVLGNGWANFQKWRTSAGCELTLSYLRALLVILSYEMNWPYEYWYGEREKLLVDEDIRKTLRGLAVAIQDATARKRFTDELEKYLGGEQIYKTCGSIGVAIIALSTCSICNTLARAFGTKRVGGDKNRFFIRISMVRASRGSPESVIVSDKFKTRTLKTAEMRHAKSFHRNKAAPPAKRVLKCCMLFRVYQMLIFLVVFVFCLLDKLLSLRPFPKLFRQIQCGTPSRLI